MKILVITTHATRNYGAILQAYATQQKFIRMGYDCKIIDYRRTTHRDDTLLESKLSMHKKWNKNVFSRFLYRCIKNPSFRRFSIVVNSFISNHLILTDKQYITFESLCENIPEADVYCSGSDQIWNNAIWGKFIKAYFLEFVPERKKCVSLCSSFGRSDFNEFEKKELHDLLKKYSDISTREKTGLNVLNSVGRNDAVQLVDPSLALDSVCWKELLQNNRIRGDYLLIYQLNRNKDFDNYAAIVAKKKGLRLVRIVTDYSQFFSRGKKIFFPSVEEFLTLFNYASFVITDSFHGTAFSLNFNKQFLVFHPPKFSTRIDSILQLMNLERRLVNNISDISILDDQIVYDHVNENINKERQRVDEYIYSIMKT